MAKALLQAAKYNTRLSDFDELRQFVVHHRTVMKQNQPCFTIEEDVELSLPYYFG